MPVLRTLAGLIVCALAPVSWYIYFFPWKSFYAQWATCVSASLVTSARGSYRRNVSDTDVSSTNSCSLYGHLD